jgi:hypothetical protein
MTAAIAPSNFAVHGPPSVESRTLLNLLIVDDDAASAKPAAKLLPHLATGPPGRSLPSRLCV